MSVEINTIIASLSSKRVTVHANPNTTIERLQKILGDQLGVFHLELRLVHGGRTLNLDRTLHDYGFQSGTMMHVFLTERGLRQVGPLKESRQTKDYAVYMPKRLKGDWQPPQCSISVLALADRKTEHEFEMTVTRSMSTRSLRMMIREKMSGSALALAADNSQSHHRDAWQLCVPTRKSYDADALDLLTHSINEKLGWPMAIVAYNPNDRCLLVFIQDLREYWLCVVIRIVIRLRL